MEYALFLGCTSPVRGINYEASTRKVAESFDIKLIDLEDFACCGFPVEAVTHSTSLIMAARNLCIAKEEGLDIITICNACTATLTRASKLLKEDKKIREEVNSHLEAIGREYKGSVEVKHFGRLLYEDVGVEKIEKKIVQSLEGLRIAAHYGCHYLKPSEIYDGFDDPEVPVSLDNLIEATGATSIDYEDKRQCCGGAILGIDEMTSLEMTKEKLDHVKAAKADAMTVICPFCSIMYDANQKGVEIKFEVEKYNIPVLYYPQLLGLALGYEFKELGLHKNKVKAKDLVKSILPDEI